MKKIIIAIFIALIALSTSIFSMGSTEGNGQAKKVEFAKTDYIKTGISLLGMGVSASVAWKTFLLLRSCYAVNHEDYDACLKAANGPHLDWSSNFLTRLKRFSFSEILVCVLLSILMKSKNKKDVENACIAQMVVLGIVSSACGIYVCKKLYQFKQAKFQQSR